MKARRLRWHGASRQTALANWLRLELGTWLEGWSVDPALLTLRIADTRMSPTSGWKWTRATSRTGSVTFGAHAAVLDGLGGYLAKAAHEDVIGLGRRIGARALRALLTQFMGGAANLIDITDVSAPSADEQDPRFGCCGLVLQGSGFEARLLIDSDLFEYWVPPQRPALPALFSREAALGNERVTLDVVLDLGNAKLADAHQLQIGEVLVSNTSINSVFQLALPDSRRLVSANLVRTGMQRALQIDATSLRKVS